MSLSRSTRALCLALALAPGGCAGARYVSREPSGGVVAIPANTNFWPTYYRRSAEELMLQQCPGGYVIDREGEAVIGTTTTVNATAENSSLIPAVFGVGTQTRTTQSRDITEWHITFHARGTPAPTPPPPPGLTPADQPPPALPSRPVPVAGPF